jgi:HEPN domain-containing protein
MNDEYFQEWIRKAEEDYEVALVLIRKRKQPTPSAVGFHCQQCAEKYLKAYLIKSDVRFPRIHDLLELHRLCLALNPSFELVGDLLDRLNPFAVEFRYPGEDLSVEEAKLAVKTVTEVRKFIREVVGI